MINVVLYFSFLAMVASIFVDDIRFLRVIAVFMVAAGLCFGLYSTIDFTQDVVILNSAANGDVQTFLQDQAQLSALVVQETELKDVKTSANLSTENMEVSADRPKQDDVDLFVLLQQFASLFPDFMVNEDGLLKSGWVAAFAIFLSKGLTFCFFKQWWPFNESKPTATGSSSIWKHVAICAVLISAKIYVCGGIINPMNP